MQKTSDRRNWIWIASLLLLFQYFLINRDQKQVVTYNDFLNHIEQKDLDQVLLGKDRIEAKLKSADPKKAKVIFTNRVEDPDLVTKLKNSNVSFSGIPESTWWSSLLTWLGSFMILFFFWRFFFGRIQGPQSEMLTFGKSKAKVYVERDLKTKFNDVAGVDEAKEELKEVVEFLKSPDKFTKLGGRMPKGILLVGPPGTGKTLLARAVAGEAGVSFFSINGSEFVEMFVGLGAARVRDLFQQARKNVPCIIFIDELDALGKARGISVISGGSNEEKEQTLNQLLAELDGFDPSPGVVLLAATNRPEILDPALLRSGRFDRQIAIDKPDRKGREAILNIHLKKIKVISGIDVSQLASITSGFSGADLENLVNEAALVATRRQASEVEMEDFTHGVERIIGGMERKSRVIGADEKKRVAFHEMGHATLSLSLKDHSETIHKVSIIPRGISALGYTMRRPTEDRYLMSQSELESKIMVLLGGRASEEFFYHDLSTGAADDLDRVTELARSMIMQYGMGKNLGILTYEKMESPYLGLGLIKTHDFSEETAIKIDREINELVDHCYHLTLEKVAHHRNFIEEGVKRLLIQESLNENDLLELKREFFPSMGKNTNPVVSIPHDKTH